MDDRGLVDRIRIASPCPALWSEMNGDDRARFCGQCEKHVYNIAALTANETSALVERTEGTACMRLYRRRDGTVLTADCPEGARLWARSRFQRVATSAVVALSLVTTGSIVLGARGLRTIPPPPTGPGVTFEDWKDWALVVLGIREPYSAGVAGIICIDPAEISNNDDSADSFDDWGGEPAIEP